MSEQQQSFQFDGWAIFEAFGHRKRAGKVRTTEMGGSAFFVVETPKDDEFVTEVYAASALYALTPVTEEIARMAARSVNPAPISPYDLPAEWRVAIRTAEIEKQRRARAIDAGAEEHGNDYEREEDARGRAEFERGRFDNDNGPF